MSKFTMSEGLKTKGISVFLTLLVIVTLVMLGPASAISLYLSEIDNTQQGQKVQFSIEMDLEAPDQYLPIAYTELVFTGPNGFEEVCNVFNDGSYNGCDLDLEIEVIFNTGYGQGHGMGYGYGYNYGYNYQYFGYGYGYGYGNYGEGPEAIYNIVWNTPAEINSGDYDVQARTHVIQEDYYDEFPFSYCSIMYGMYQVALFYQNAVGNITYYDPIIDLNQDGIINIIDFSIYAQDYYYSGGDESGELYGRFSEYYRIAGSLDENISYNLDLDVFPEGGDGVVDLDDIIVFAGYYNDEDGEHWCAEQMGYFHEGNYEIYESNKQTFVITAPPVQTGSSGGRSRSNVEDEEEELGEEDISVEELEETQQEENLITTESTTNNQEQSNSVFNAITGAIVGAGDSIGLGATLSYLVVLLIFVLAVVAISRRVTKKRN